MPEKTLTEEIITIVKSHANDNPAPEKCLITKTYPDNNHVDATTETGTYNYIETISNNPTTGNTGIIIYLNGDKNKPIIITR